MCNHYKYNCIKKYGNIIKIIWSSICGLDKTTFYLTNILL